MHKYIKELHSLKKKIGKLFVVLLLGELILLPTAYSMEFLIPAHLDSVTVEFSVALIVRAGQYSNWTTPRLGASGEDINVLRAKKGYYFQLESIIFLYMGKEIEAEGIIKRDDYTLQWFINHTFIQFRSERMIDPYSTHNFGNFTNSLRELISLQGTWKSNKLNYSLNQRGTASIPVLFTAFINSSPSTDENVNLTAFTDRCGFFYITYALLWDRDYYYAFESIIWLVILAIIVDILVLLRRKLKTARGQTE